MTYLNNHYSLEYKLIIMLPFVYQLSQLLEIFCKRWAGQTNNSFVKTHELQISFEPFFSDVNFQQRFHILLLYQITLILQIRRLQETRTMRKNKIKNQGRVYNLVNIYDWKFLRKKLTSFDY